MSIFHYRPFLIVAAMISTVGWADEALLKLRPFVKQHCVECHGPDKQKGDIRLDTLGHDLSQPQVLEIWQGVLDQLNLGEMPPKKQSRPELAQVQEVVDVLTQLCGRRTNKLETTGDIPWREQMAN